MRSLLKTKRYVVEQFNGHLKENVLKELLALAKRFGKESGDGYGWIDKL